MKIYKYGGNILKDQSTRNSIYKQLKKEQEPILLVVSAFKETPYSTDSLTHLLANQEDFYLTQRMQTTGELISAIIICSELKNLYFNCDILYPEELGIQINKTQDKIEIENLDATQLNAKLKGRDILVCPGFTGKDKSQQIVSLNRGGSDLTAILLAQMTQTKEVTFFKDVPGVGLCDPKYYTHHKILENVSYDKMILFAKHGSNLIQLEALKMAKEYQIELRIKHFAIQNTGTLINDKKGDSSLGIHIKDQKIYIDGFNNATYIKKILFENELPYDLLITIQDSIEITTPYHNEKEILTLICKNLLRS